MITNSSKFTRQASKVIMESSNDTNITELLDSSHYDDIFSNVSLVATYLKILLLVVTIPATITPAAVIIHIIRKTEELHTNYCLFLVNLLISDALTTIKYCIGIIIMILYLFNIRIYISDIVYIFASIPQVVTRYSFVLLAIDRVVGVAFPYRYRNIMKPRVVYALITSVWIIAAVLLSLVRIILGPPYLVWQFGLFIPPSGASGAIFTYLLPQAVSVILTVGINAYLYRSIIRSKKKLASNLQLSGKDDHKVTRLQRLIHNLQVQLESSLPVFVLGGVDCLLNVLHVVTFIVVSVNYPLSFAAIPRIYFMQFLVNPLEYCQIISHSITYGVYQKTVRKKLHKYYQRLQRVLPPCPSKVITLHPQ